MARLYTATRELFLTGQLSWLDGDLRCVLLSPAFTPDFTDEFLQDIPAGPRIAVSDLLTGRTATDGYASCDPISFLSLSSSLQVSQAVIYLDTGDESTSRLLYYIDEDSLIGIPFVPAGVDYYIYPNVVEGGLFRL